MASSDGDGRLSGPWPRVAAAVFAVAVVVVVARDDGKRETSLSNSATPAQTSASTTANGPSSTTGIASTTPIPDRAASSPTTTAKSSSSTASLPPDQSAGDLAGLWGGDHVILKLTDTGGNAEYDCAAGTIDESLRPDSRGNFDALGWHTNQPGGPIEPSSDRRPLGARYSGWTDGSRMNLTVTLTDSGKEVGQFKLERGRHVNLDRCS